MLSDQHVGTMFALFLYVEPFPLKGKNKKEHFQKVNDPSIEQGHTHKQSNQWEDKLNVHQFPFKGMVQNIGIKQKMMIDTDVYSASVTRTGSIFSVFKLMKPVSKWVVIRKPHVMSHK